MTEKKRIALNIAATYGRSLYSMAIGLFTCRWVLESLGHVDYGLMGVVGGLTGFVSFFNGLLAESVGRFYAFSVGKANAAEDRGSALEECRAWFSVALLLHTVVPIFLVIVGYPIGLWMVENWLVIPSERVADCIWVWRISCVSCFIGMVNVPFQAMYTAKQEIAELTIYSFVGTTLNALFVYYMVCHPGVWLVRFCFWSCFLVFAPQLIICLRACIKYPECRFRHSVLHNAALFKELFVYVSSRFLGATSQMVTSQGMNLVVNKMLGPVRNAAMAIGVNLASKALTLKGSLTGALAPAITNAAGAGDYDKVRRFACRTNVLSVLSIAVFALPLILEVDEVMILWLKKPPEMSARLCQLWLIAYLIDQSTIGHVMALFAKGKIVVFQVFESVIWISALIIAWCAVFFGMDIAGVGLGWMVMFSIDNVLKIYCGRRECGLSVRVWFTRVLCPLTFTCVATIAVGAVVVLLFRQSFGRLCLTTAVCEVVFLPLVWKLVLEPGEREMLLSKLHVRKRI